MKVTTKNGDKGRTRLFGGKSVSKCDLRIQAGGALDEAISFLGLAKVKAKDKTTKDMIDLIQKDISRIIVEISGQAGKTKGFKNTITSGDVKRLEEIGNIIERKTGVVSGFVIPGRNEGSASIHIARAVTRRAECLAVELNVKKKINPNIIAYLNRLSDLLYVLARREEGEPDPLKYD